MKKIMLALFIALIAGLSGCAAGPLDEQPEYPSKKAPQFGRTDKNELVCPNCGRKIPSNFPGPYECPFCKHKTGMYK
jgi:DNA-directed RNA polymerase subunit RPC12/RpoP